MRVLPFILLAVIAFFSNACEKQPLAGEPDPRIDKPHGLAKHEGAAAEKKAEHTDPAKGPRSEEVPKFFPEKK